MGRTQVVFLSAILAAFSSLTFAQAVKPIAPSNPVEVSVEVGSIAGQFSAKVVVRLQATVGKKGTVFTTVLEKLGEFDYTKIELDAETTASLVTALTETTANADADYTKDVGPLHIENRENESKRLISIRTKEEGILLRSKRIDVDSDNALVLQTQLKKLQGIQAWMKDKVVVFEKK